MKDIDVGFVSQDGMTIGEYSAIYRRAYELPIPGSPNAGETRRRLYFEKLIAEFRERNRERI